MDTAYLEALFGLEGKVAVVTGGGGVLCGAMSRALGRAGAKVAVLDLFPEAAQQVAGRHRGRRGRGASPSPATSWTRPASRPRATWCWRPLAGWTS